MLHFKKKESLKLKPKPDGYIDPLSKIQEHLRKQTYKVKAHALQRLNQRFIVLKDVLFVLRTGRHEESKTSFDLKWQSWKYAIRGKTLDGVELRVIVALVKEMAIITVIKLTKGGS